jgi:hypothetical protein
MNNDIALPIGQKVFLPRHFDVAVILEDARILGRGYEFRFRLPDGSQEEAVISFEEAASLAKSFHPTTASLQLAKSEKIGLLAGSARIRLAYTHDRQFAVSMSGI